MTKHDSFATIDDLVKYCENFEATKRDTVKLKAHPTTSDLGVNNVDDEFSHDEVVAALSMYKRSKNQASGKEAPDSESPCAKCGYAKHTKGASCPARDQFCLKCGRKGHFVSVCRSRNPKGKDTVSGALLCSVATANSLPQLPVVIGKGFLAKAIKSNVVADTGAQGTVAGTGLLETLKIKRSWLNPPENNLRHVGGGKVNTIGSCYMSFAVNKQMTIQKVYFVPGIQHIFLSLEGCKELRFSVWHCRGQCCGHNRTGRTFN